MSDTEVKRGVSVTLKGDGAAPWIVAHGIDAAETERHLMDVLKLNLHVTAADANALFVSVMQAARGLGAAASTPQGTRVPPSSQYQQAQQPNAAPAPGPAPTQSFNGTPHPEGLRCQKCGAAVVGKQPKVKRMWTCPNQREKGDGHYQEWIG